MTRFRILLVFLLALSMIMIFTPSNTFAEIIRGTNSDDMLFGTTDDDKIMGFDGTSAIKITNDPIVFVSLAGTPSLVSNTGEELISRASDFIHGIALMISDANPLHAFAQSIKKPEKQPVSCADGSQPNSAGKCRDGSQPRPVGGILLCADGSQPNSAGKCRDGSQPRHVTSSSTPLGSGGIPFASQLVCASGIAATADGKCADGSVPSPYQLVCPSGVAMAGGICADGSVPHQSLFVCANGVAATAQGCADGSVPRIGTTGGTDTPSGSQLVCASGIAATADGKCTDGSVPGPG